MRGFNSSVGYFASSVLRERSAILYLSVSNGPLIAWLMGCHWKGRKLGVNRLSAVRPGPFLDIEGLELWLT
jgi:hypothetical protein